MLTVTELKNLFESYIETQKFMDEPEGLFQPMNYILDLGGKRIRPVTALMAYNIFRDDVERAMPMAYSLELFHNFTLAHDDIMDNADLRRGKPAMHTKYSVNTGILSGDAMMIFAFQYLINCAEDDRIQRKLNSIFTKTALEVCIGQQMDMDFETQEDVSLDAYLTMIQYKTAVLLAGCLQTGAILAGASDADSDELYNFGLNLGMGFQIQDDILDLYGDDNFGKKRGGDIMQNKKTFLYLTAMKEADDKTKNLLINYYRTKTHQVNDKLFQMEKIFERLNVRQIAEKRMKSYTDEAFECLDRLSVQNEKLTVLKDLGNRLLNRTY